MMVFWKISKTKRGGSIAIIVPAIIMFQSAA
jgi:hypothetical protein